AAENERLAAELQRLHAGMPARDVHTPELAAEVDRLRARLAEAEAGAAHEHRVREQLEATLERGTSSGRLEVRQGLEAARQAETARAALVAENQRLAAELSRLRAGVPRDEQHASELTAEIHRLRARLADAEAGAAHEHRAREGLENALEQGSSSGR